MFEELIGISVLLHMVRFLPNTVRLSENKPLFWSIGNSRLV